MAVHGSRFGEGETVLKVFRRIRPTSAVIASVMALQFILASVFILDLVLDVTGLRDEPPSYTFREGVQIAAWFGLVFGIVINGVLFRDILRKGARLEQRVHLASRAFQEMVDERFDDWSLSPSERDVALLAIKGFSNAEIAAYLEKSEGTVKAQSNAVFRKSGLAGRVQLISFFMDEMLGAPELTQKAPPPVPEEEFRRSAERG